MRANVPQSVAMQTRDAGAPKFPTIGFPRDMTARRRERVKFGASH